MRHRPVKADVDEGLNVGDDRVHIFRKSSWRNHAAGHQVDEDKFISCRVTVRQRHNPDCIGRLPLKRLDNVVILFLDPNDAFARANKLHGDLHAAQEGFGEVLEQFLVLVKQRFTFSGVGDHQRNAGSELRRRGKPTAAGANDAEFFKTIGRRVSGRAPRQINSRLPCISRHTGSTSKFRHNSIDSELNCTVLFKIIQ